MPYYSPGNRPSSGAKQARNTEVLHIDAPIWLTAYKLIVYVSLNTHHLDLSLGLLSYFLRSNVTQHAYLLCWLMQLTYVMHSCTLQNG